MTDQYIELEWKRINKEKLKQIISDNPDLLEKEMEGRYFFPKKGDVYSLMHYYEGVVTAKNEGKRADMVAISIWAYKTMEQAKQARRRRQALVSIWKYVQENWLYFEPDRDDVAQDKYVIWYNHKYNSLYEGIYCTCQYTNDLPYFRSIDDMIQVRKACKEDYLIYFDKK